LTKNIRIILFMLMTLLLVASFFVLILQVPEIMRWNTDLFLWLNQFYWQPLAVSIALLEELDVLIYVVLICILIYYKRHDLALSIIIAIVIETMFVSLLKQAVALDRPFNVLNGVSAAYRPSDYSFPSGHAGRAFAALSVWCFREKKHYLALLGLATLISISRVYIGVHYPLDVIVGAIIGLLIGYSVARLDLKPLLMWLTGLYFKAKGRANAN